jgi:YVTN family beta-propeller protein
VAESLSNAPVRTFLIADMRGYTRYTQDEGDDAAGRLAAEFARLSRSAVEAHGGNVIELRGDEALCVFGSARQALRAAVELQTRFRRREDGRPVFPLPIGIGLDAGEAVPTEGGYRGGALNTASRLCSLAGPGEILATETVVSLARRLEGIRFVERRPVRVKGLEKPVRVIEVRSERDLPPPPHISAARPFVTRRRLAAGAGLALLVVIALGVLFLTREENVDVRPNSVAVIDPSSNGVVDSIPVGESPGPITFAGDALWVANLNDGTLSKVDPGSRNVTETVGLGEPGTSESLPPRLAGDDDDLWVATDCFRQLLRMDPEDGSVGQTLTLRGAFGSRQFYSCALTAAPGSVWIAADTPYQLVRVREAADEPASIAQRIPLPVAVRTGIALGAGSIWVSERANLEGVATRRSAIRRVDAETGEVVETIPVDEGPEAIVFAYGSVWVVNGSEDSVLRIQPQTNAVVREIPVGKGPSAIAAGAGALWVANTGDGTVSRIDPATRSVTNTIELGHRPLGVLVHDDLVWVTVRE